jgi:hypothetical protein
MAFPLLGFVGLERLLGVGCDDLCVGASVRSTRIHPVKRLAHAPRERFFAPPSFGILFIF